ncbi:MAG: TIGR00730 family Rossman fold protein, partial [Rickettsiales bacterium]
MNDIKSICVFCGSNPGANIAYTKNTKVLAETLVSNNIKLIYGGAALGLMGSIADNVLSLGGKAIGVMPRALIDKELAHKNLTEIHIVETMHERKALMADLSDGFILYPGGIGSLEEFFEIWTWAQLYIHEKPYGILNIEGYYDKLIDFLKHTAEEKFVHQDHISGLIIDRSSEILLKKFREFKPIQANKWL